MLPSPAGVGTLGDVHPSDCECPTCQLLIGCGHTRSCLCLLHLLRHISLDAQVVCHHAAVSQRGWRKIELVPERGAILLVVQQAHLQQADMHQSTGQGFMRASRILKGVLVS